MVVAVTRWPAAMPAARAPHAHRGCHLVPATMRRRWAVIVGFAVLTTGGCTFGSGADQAERSSGPAVRDATSSPRETSPSAEPSAGQERAPVPSATSASGAAEVWVATESGFLVRVDLQSGLVVERVAAGGAAHNITTMPDEAAVATVPSRGAIVFGGRDPAVLELGGRPHDVKATGEGVVVADGSGPRLALVGSAGDVAWVQLPGTPHDVAVTSDGRRAWATLDGRDEVVEVDLIARRVLRDAHTGRRPHDLLFSPSGELWVTDWGGGLYPLSGDGSVGPELELGQEAHHLAFSADGAELWVTDSPGRSVSVVDVRRRVLQASIELAGSPHHVAVVGDRVAIADNTNGQIVVIDRVSRQVVTEVDVSARPHGVAG